jgi:hypothetical protein
MYSVVAASFDHGRTFPQVRPLVPGASGNWGDRDFIAVSRNGTVYLTWVYGPNAAQVKYTCSYGESCAVSSGELNVVIQKSLERGEDLGIDDPCQSGLPSKRRGQRAAHRGARRPN